MVSGILKYNYLMDESPRGGRNLQVLFCFFILFLSMDESPRGGRNIVPSFWRKSTALSMDESPRGGRNKFFH